MSYIIDKIKFHLSNPINKYWYAKYKKRLLKGYTQYFTQILSDAKNKRKITYSSRYYACAKFIKATTHLRYKKEQKHIYWVRTYNDDLIDTYTVSNESELVCSNKNKLVADVNTRWSSGKHIGMCTNKCCYFICKPDKFDIQWV